MANNENACDVAADFIGNVVKHRGGRKAAKMLGLEIDGTVEKQTTPTKDNTGERDNLNVTTAVNVSQIASYTPRRSARKSTRTIQDYDEIISKRTLRSAAKKLSEIVINEEREPSVPRWTPAKVGRVSQKRRKRARNMSSVGHKNKKTIDDSESESDEKPQEHEKEDKIIETINTDILDQPVTQDKLNVKKDTPKLNETFEIEKESSVQGALDDLGIAPLPIEQSDNLFNDMPSLIFIDDDVEDSDEIGKKTDVHENKDDIKKTAENVPIPTLVITDTSNVKATEILQLQNVVEKTKKEVTMTTPTIQLDKQRSKIIRVPTPYKTHNVRKLKTATGKELEKSSPTSTLEPSKIALQATRRRSKSTSSIANNRKRKAPGASVTFCSPANETICIEEFDAIIAKTVGPNSDQPEQAVKIKQNKAVDSGLKSDIVSAQNKSGTTPNKIRQTPQKVTTRTKLPNFAVIHQKQFEKMESLVDHVARKMERAKNLVNSSSKIPSARKEIVNKQLHNKENGKASVSKPKAMKSINMDSSSKFNELTSTELVKLDKLPKPDLGNLKMPSKSKSDPKFGAVKPNPLAKPLVKASTTLYELRKELEAKQSKKVLEVKQSKKALEIKQSNKEMEIKNLKKELPAAKQGGQQQQKQTLILPQQKDNWRPPLQTKASVKMFDLPATTKSSATLGSSETNISIDKDKIAARRQRHMDMFKGRTASSRSATNTTRTNTDFIRGVRLNRRFDLQMQHRQNMD